MAAKSGDLAGKFRYAAVKLSTRFIVRLAFENTTAASARHVDRFFFFFFFGRKKAIPFCAPAGGGIIWPFLR